MKAVNLIPSESQGGRGTPTGLVPRSPALIPLALLAAALLLVTVYVLTQNSISDRKVQLARAQSELSTVKAQADRLARYAQFQQLAQARIATIRQIASSRFDWNVALTSLSKVVPANTSLQSLLGTVSPDASVSAGGGSSVPSSQSLRSAIPNPAFAMQGCTNSHDDVARLISRLRLMDGVLRVTLADSQKSDTGQTGASVSSGSAASGGCGPSSPSFDLIVFFKPLPGAPSTSTTGTSTSVVSSATSAATATATTPGSAATTTQQTTTTATTSQALSTPAPGAAR